MILWLGRESVFFRFWTGEAPEALLVLLCPRPNPGGSGVRDLFLDFAETFLVSEGLSLDDESDLNFLEGVGPTLLILSTASLRFTALGVSVFEWWPKRSSIDVPAASGSSCKANEAMDSARPLLLGKKTNIIYAYTHIQRSEHYH